MDRTLFLADEISCMMVDDFFNLPATPIVGRVCKPLDARYWRQVDLFAFTH